MSDLESNFENVKVGDKLAVFQYGNLQRKVEVIRITKTWLITSDGLKYAKKDGYEIGYIGGGHPRLVEITEVLENEIETKALISKIGNAKLGKLSLEKLRAINKILETE